MLCTSLPEVFLSSCPLDFVVFTGVRVVTMDVDSALPPSPPRAEDYASFVHEDVVMTPSASIASTVGKAAAAAIQDSSPPRAEDYASFAYDDVVMTSFVSVASTSGRAVAPLSVSDGALITPTINPLTPAQRAAMLLATETKATGSEPVTNFKRRPGNRYETRLSCHTRTHSHYLPVH